MKRPFGIAKVGRVGPTFAPDLCDGNSTENPAQLACSQNVGIVQQLRSSFQCDLSAHSQKVLQALREATRRDGEVILVVQDRRLQLQVRILSALQRCF